ncbi:hypothetical protein OF83DRAFT_1068931, partial [Amylostereum chailletii]
MQTGTRLRYLFAVILEHCRPSNPGELWIRFRHLICDDLGHRLRTLGLNQPSDDDIYDYGLFLLDRILRDSGKSLDHYPSMPRPEHDWSQHEENLLISEQLDYDHEHERAQANSRSSRLNPDQ